MHIALGLTSVALLVLANGFFVATEFAIVAVRRSRLDELAKAGNSTAETAREVVGHLDSYLATCQLGITMASLALGWIGEPAIARLIEPPLESIAEAVAPTMAHAVAIGFSFGLITIFHIVLGEQAAKGLALQRTEATALFVARPMRLLFAVFRWPVMALNAMCNTVLGLFGMHSAWGEDLPRTVEELRLDISRSREAGIVQASGARIVNRAFELAHITASSLLTPRTGLEAIPVNTGLDALVHAAQTSSHTRLLVYTDSLDDIIGVLHVRDLFKALPQSSDSFDLRSLLRPVLTVPESKRADTLLEEMRTEGRQVAVIIDEFGSTAGIVTLWDVVAGLVGRIENEPPADQPTPSRVETDGSLIFDGLTRLEDFEEMTSIYLNGTMNGKAETVGGLVMASLGHMPGIGDRVLVEGRLLEVLDMDGLRVARVRLLQPNEGERNRQVK